LTISPELLNSLQSNESTLEPALDRQHAYHSDAKKISLDKESFQIQLKANAMASQKLEEGIASFCADAVKIEQLLTN